MQTNALRFYSLEYRDLRTWLFAALFVAGNILLPQVCHLFSLGGPTWLPIYFFTLVGACKYGWRVGLLTAVASPVMNSLLFGMPVTAMVPVILVKSVLLSLFAAVAVAHFKRVSLLLLVAVVVAYQVVGTLAEWAIVGDFYTALQDFRIGLPGMFVQVLGGWAVVNLLKNK